MDSESAVPADWLRGEASVFLEKRVWKRIRGGNQKRLFPYPKAGKPGEKSKIPLAESEELRPDPGGAVGESGAEISVI